MMWCVIRENINDSIHDKCLLVEPNLLLVLTSSVAFRIPFHPPISIIIVGLPLEFLWEKWPHNHYVWVPFTPHFHPHPQNAWAGIQARQSLSFAAHRESSTPHFSPSFSTSECVSERKTIFPFFLPLLSVR